MVTQKLNKFYVDLLTLTNSKGQYLLDPANLPMETVDVVLEPLTEVEAIIGQVSSNRPSIFEMALLKSYYDSISFAKERDIQLTSRQALFQDAPVENEVLGKRIRYDADNNDAHMIGTI